MFDQLCPTGSLPSKIKLCILLVTTELFENEDKFRLMRNFIREGQFPKERYRFMYIYRDKQTEFVKSLAPGFKNGNIFRGIHVVVLWRKEPDHVFYEWLDNEWDLIDSNYINETKDKLSSLLALLSRNAEAFPFNSHTPSLTDEGAKSLLSRIVKKLLLVTENLSENISRSDPTPIISFGLTVTVITLIGYAMVYFM